MKSLLFITVLFFALPAYSQVDHLRQINSRPGHTTVYVNEYTNVTAFDRCGNRMTVGDASNFSKGDTILIAQNVCYIIKFIIARMPVINDVPKTRCITTVN